MRKEYELYNSSTEEVEQRLMLTDQEAAERNADLRQEGYPARWIFVNDETRWCV